MEGNKVNVTPEKKHRTNRFFERAKAQLKEVGPLEILESIAVIGLCGYLGYARCKELDAKLNCEEDLVVRVIIKE